VISPAAGALSASNHQQPQETAMAAKKPKSKTRAASAKSAKKTKRPARKT
jgi:hypothetical protein